MKSYDEILFKLHASEGFGSSLQMSHKINNDYAQEQSKQLFPSIPSQDRAQIVIKRGNFKVHLNKIF